jgi:hypothetical protein
LTLIEARNADVEVSITVHDFNALPRPRKFVIWVILLIVFIDG